MESATPSHNCSKRKTTSSPPPQQDIHHTDTIPIDIDNTEHRTERAAKRPRLSIVASESGGLKARAQAKLDNARRRLRGASKPSDPSFPASSSSPLSPSPPPQDIEISSTPQEYLLQHSQPSPSYVTVKTGSLLSPLQDATSPSVPSPVCCPAIPPNIVPTINRETLHELDLESILKNAQLRHDLLFDPGLQFRAVAGKRRQTATDLYWDTIAHELNHSCICDAGTDCSCCDKSNAKKQHDKPKVRPPTPPPWSHSYDIYCMAAQQPHLLDPHVNSKSGDYYTGLLSEYPLQPRPLSPIPTMLRELMAVLTCVIAPPPLPSSPPARPSYLHSLTEAETVLQHIDPDLITQELRRSIYEPAGLFKLLGETLKRHCAPMRDGLIDEMVAAAAKEGVLGTQRTLTACRLCFEVLELMKLDIANHQLQHLRPFLAVSTPKFLLRVFSDRCRQGIASLVNIQSFLQNSYDKIVTLSIPSYIPTQPYPAISSIPAAFPPTLRRMQIHMALIKAMSELIFAPPAGSYPETLYLDTARVSVLVADAADLSALYMLMMLWRQLVYWKEDGVNGDGNDNNNSDRAPGSSESGSDSHRDAAAQCGARTLPRFSRKNIKLEQWEVDRIKKEIWEVSPKRLGSCFIVEDGECKIPEQYQRINQMVFDDTKWHDAMENVAVQIASRAEDARTCDGIRPPSSTATATGITHRRTPSQAAVTVMNGWIRTHLRRQSNSPLLAMFRSNLQREVCNAAMRITFNALLARPPNQQPTQRPNTLRCISIVDVVPAPENGAAGLEALMPEIRHLGQKVAKLALVNMQAYWSLYEAEGFLKDPNGQYDA